MTWRAKVLAYYHRPLSNGRTEAMNLLIQKVKRVWSWFRNFGTSASAYCCTADSMSEPATARIRGRVPSFAA
jgi:hypothetical protein